MLRTDDDCCLKGTETDIENAVRKCMEDAAPGGRYILSSADQITRNTPFSHIDALVKYGRKYGKY